MTEQTRRSSRRSIRGLLDRPYEQPEAELTFDFSSIRKKLNFKTSYGSENERPAKRQKRDVIKCYCHLTIWDNRENQGATPLSSKSQYCRVTTTETVSDGNIVDLELDKPFVVKADELKVPIATEHGSILGMIENYFLELKIIPCKNDSRWPPIPILGKSDGDHFARDTRRNGTEELQGALVARYTHLPQAPEPDVPLSVFYLREGRTYRSKYGLQVICSWETSRGRSKSSRPRGEGLDLDSFLSDNPGTAHSQNKPSGLSRPRSAYSTRTSQPEIRYDICSETEPNLRVCTVQGYRCPLCTRWKTSKLEQLQFHFLTTHSKYSFSVQNPQRGLAVKDLTQVQIKVAAIKKEEDDGKVFHWRLPAAPLDLPAFLDGDDSWLGLPSPKTSSLDAPIPVPIPCAPRPASGFPLAADVPDFRKPRRKKFRAIKLQTHHPGGELVYTSVSHRPVATSEDARSETDDEFDNTWQIDLHMERLDLEAKRQGWNDLERELLKRWDRHRMEEQLEHSRYLSNCLIRFVRKNRDWLKEGCDDLLVAFFDLLDRLKVQDVIDDDVICEVNAMIFADSSATNTVARQKLTVGDGVNTRNSSRSGRQPRHGTKQNPTHDVSLGSSHSREHGRRRASSIIPSVSLYLRALFEGHPAPPQERHLVLRPRVCDAEGALPPQLCPTPAGRRKSCRTKREAEGRASPAGRVWDIGTVETGGRHDFCQTGRDPTTKF